MKQRSGAFTLIELMVVVTVIGIAVVMIVPQFAGSHQEALLRASGRKLVAVLKLARSQAVTTRQRVRLHLEEGRYWLETEPRADFLETLPEASDFQPLVSVPQAAGEIDSRIAVELRKLQGAGEGSSTYGASAMRTGPGDSSPGGGLPGRDTVLFEPRGTAEAAEFLLEDQQGFTLCVRLEAVTGRVETRKLEQAGR